MPTNIYERVKCAASIDASGYIVAGAAAPGFVAPVVSLTGDTPYTLESADGEWETGFISISAGGAYVSFGTAKRAVGFVSAGLDAATGCFPPNTTGLILTQGATTSNVWKVRAGNGVSAGSATALDGSVEGGVMNSIAIGTGSSVAGANSLALGVASNTQSGFQSIAVGHSAKTSLSGEVQVGSPYYMSHERSWPVKAYAQGNGAAAVRFAQVTTGGALGTADGDAINLQTVLYQGGQGPVKVRAVLDITNTFPSPNDVNNHKVVEVTYMVYVTTGAATLLGTPTITTLYSGAGAPSSTIAIDSGGHITLVCNTTDYLDARGIVYADCMTAHW
jgi:hypothetical protein